MRCAGSESLPPFCLPASCLLCTSGTRRNNPFEYDSYIDDVRVPVANLTPRPRYDGRAVADPTSFYSYPWYTHAIKLSNAVLFPTFDFCLSVYGTPIYISLRETDRLHVGSSGWNRICADSSAPSTLIGGSSETTTATSTSTGKPGTGMKSNGIGKATANASLRPVKTSTLLSRLPSLARRDAPQVKRHDSRPPSPPHPGPPPNTSDSRSAKHGPPTRQSAPDGARNSPSGGTADAGRGASGTPINGFESSYGALAGQPRRQAMPVDGRDAEGNQSLLLRFLIAGRWSVR